MKKILYCVIIFFILNNSIFAKPFLSTSPCARVEFFQITTEDNITKEKFNNIVLPQADDSLVADLFKDLTIISKDADLKITIIASNSDGDSNITSFNLKINTENNVTTYIIEPIPEENNPSYLDKYVVDQLEVKVVEGGGNDGGNGGCFINTLLKQ